MLLNFYKRLEITGRETVWPINPTRNFFKNFSKNVPKGTTVVFEPAEGVIPDIVIYWIEKNDIAIDIIAQYINSFGKALWLVLQKGSFASIETAVAKKGEELGFRVSKTADFTLTEIGVKIVKR
ncbi:MAG: hypothetical protein UW05_C0036G0005 [Candidatus Giovannonibacteria bacterium GW2011_GWC2_43_8]|nr:MAG: hypothetical protein UW05_C0036G0005 [Candidatus Giovannonibacteria bacterium GW2011_GWC2_43_8]